MIKNIFLLLILFTAFLNANKVSEVQCSKKGDNFIFAGGECIEYAFFEGEGNEKLNIIVHGTWDKGTNTLGRYAPFAENIAMNTDVNTVAIALTGYSKSSTNNFPSLADDKVKNLGANKKYLAFVQELIKELTKKYKAKSITYIGHSAGCMIGATISGLKPKLIDNLVCAGGIYNIHKKTKQTNLISAVDVINNIPKDINMILIYGTKDTISKPNITKNFYNKIKNKVSNVKLIEVKNAVHIDLDMQDTSVDAISELFE